MKTCISILIFLGFLFSFNAQAQSKFKDKGKRSTLVEVKKAKVQIISEKTSAIGRLVALDPIIISSQNDQEILKIHFKIGDNIKKMIYYLLLNQKIY